MPNNIDMGGFAERKSPLFVNALGSVIDLGTTFWLDFKVTSSVANTRINKDGSIRVTSVFIMTPSGSTGVTITSTSLAWASGFGTLGGSGSGLIISYTSTGVGGIVFSAGADDFMELRRGTNAQAWRVYGTYTDASNYVRASLAATSTAVTLTAETAGTGADDVPVVLTPAGTSQVEVGNGVQFTEMTAPSAPAANKVILFAQDNGAGKTQLMALFPSGAAQQVAIEP